MVVKNDYTKLLSEVNFTGLEGSLLYFTGDQRSDINLVGGKPNLRYSLLTSISELDALGYYTNSEYPYTNIPANGSPALTLNQTLAIYDVLHGSPHDNYSVSFKDVSPLTFTEGDTSNSEIIFTQATDVYSAAGVTNFVLNLDNNGNTSPLQHGDIFLNDSWDIDQNGISDWFSSEKGTYSHFAITHEVGHALGLAHIVDNDPTLDNMQYTVMTGQPLLGMTSSTGFITETVTPTGLQLLDIAAIQAIYGINWETRDENNTQYSKLTAFASTRPNGAFIYTIWDGGGTGDTIDASDYTDGVVIDLNEGAFSSIGKSADSSIDSGRGVGLAVDNLAIAYGAVIENAIGTDGDDHLIGNDADNRLEGRAGNDRLDGGLGDDTFIGGVGFDKFYGEDGVDFLTYKTSTDPILVSYSAGDRGTIYKANGERDNFWAIEEIEATQGDDQFSIMGSATPEKVFGLGGDDHFFIGESITQSVFLDGGLGQDFVYLEGLVETDFTKTQGITTRYTSLSDPQLILEFKNIEDIRFEGTDIAYAGTWAGASSGLILGKSNFVRPFPDFDIDMSDRDGFLHPLLMKIALQILISKQI